MGAPSKHGALGINAEGLAASPREVKTQCLPLVGRGKDQYRSAVPSREDATRKVVDSCGGRYPARSRPGASPQKGRCGQEHYQMHLLERTTPQGTTTGRSTPVTAPQQELNAASRAPKHELGHSRTWYHGVSYCISTMPTPRARVDLRHYLRCTETSLLRALLPIELILTVRADNPRRAPRDLSLSSSLLLIDTRREIVLLPAADPGREPSPSAAHKRAETSLSRCCRSMLNAKDLDRPTCPSLSRPPTSTVATRMRLTDRAQRPPR